MSELLISDNLTGASENQILLFPKTNVTTGGDDQSRFLYYQLRMSMRMADGVDLIVSFLMESGVRLILNDLKAAVARGTKVRILCGNYLGITQPSALYLLRGELGDQIDLRFYNERNRSFHAKSYIFHFKHYDEIFIGSSNVSRSALTSGIEWNFRFSSQTDPEDYRKFYDTFQDLFALHSIRIDDEELKKYSRSWHRPAVYRDFDRYGDQEGLSQPGSPAGSAGDAGNAEGAGSAGNDRNASEINDTRKVRNLYQPRGPQIEALYALNQSVAEGASKALAQAPTGFGKSYLAAFFSRPYKRVLFIAHRQEILNQAEQTFRNVRPLDSTGFFCGDRKDTEQNLIFASVESLRRARYLTPDYFEPDAFNLVIYDETHHIAASQYRKILSYFRPDFMLGLTATPERMDGRDIYEFYDYNIPFEMSLRDAINKGVLCPFHYYGVFDETADYSKIHPIRGQYTEEDLDKLYLGNGKRHDLILKYYEKYRSLRALGFCSSRKHAVEMALVFQQHEIPAAAVVSGTSLDDPETQTAVMDRKEALDKLREGSLRVIFSVDIFNEGLDVPSVDMVLFLRPTQSPVIFLQQLGRGLRKAKNKPYLNVLDFIGNYQKAGLAPQLLCGDNKRTRVNTGEHDDPELYPDECIVNFDMRLIDLFKKLQQKSRGVSDRIDSEFDRIREKFGHVPSRLELFTEMDDTVYTLCMAHTAQNPFRKYLEYLHKRQLLTMEEQKIYDGIGREFLDLISTTSMTKVYKMPVLASFIAGDPSKAKLRIEVTDQQVLKAWKDFFSRGTNWKDLVSGKGNGNACRSSDSKEDYRRYQLITDRQHLANIKKNPIHFLIESGKGFFIEKEGYAIAVRDDLKEVFENEAFRKHYQDIISFRIMDYFRRRYIEEGEDAVFLFEKTVDKSLLKDGFAVPKKAIKPLLQETKLDLKRGEKAPIRIEFEGQLYAAQLTWLDFSEKYKDQIRVQIRYSKDSEICQRLNEKYGSEDVIDKDQKIKIYASGEGILRIE